MECGCTGDDYEQADYPCQHGADDDVDALISKIPDLEALVDRVRLDEGKTPGRQRRAECGDGDEHGLARQRHSRYDQPLGRCGPVGMREKARQDVRDEYAR